ncbi:MAG: DUF4876 domain-containing protein [Phocaeicola sp.]
MKIQTVKISLWGVFFSLLLLASCREKGATVELLNSVKVQVTLPDDYDASELEGLTMTMRGARTTYSAVTNAAGEAYFADILPDYYTISAAKNISPSLLLSGQLLNYSILGAEEATNILLELDEVVKTSFIVSKIYSAGVKDDANKNYTADVYIEFFNNSDEEVLLDSTYYYALSEAESTAAFPAKDSLDYFFARQVFRFISDGSTKVVAPGTSILVVNSAIDHTQNASLSVDLSVADFEAKVFSGNTQNNPSVPAVEQIFSTFPTIVNMNIVRAGENGVVLFQTTESVHAWPSWQIPGKPTSNNYYKRIPITTVLDGMEVLKSNVTPEDVDNKKRMSKKIDQGYATISNTSGYNGEVIARRIELVEDEVHLHDTNNSSNDCLVSAQVKPKKYDY